MTATKVRELSYMWQCGNVCLTTWSWEGGGGEFPSNSAIFPPMGSFTNYIYSRYPYIAIGVWSMVILFQEENPLMFLLLNVEFWKTHFFRWTSESFTMRPCSFPYRCSLTVNVFSTVFRQSIASPFLHFEYVMDGNNL